MTVSRVINGRGSVRESTRVAVESAIEQLGYSPNKAARSLASASQMKIGLLSMHPNSTYLGAILIGALEQARQSDTQVVIIEYGTDSDAAKLIRSIRQSDLDGLLVAPPVAEDPAFMQRVSHAVQAIATIGTQESVMGVSSVFVDDYQAARRMANHIISLGHRRIGFIKGSEAHHSSRQRERGFRDALLAALLEVDEALIVAGDYSYRSGLGATEKLLSLDPPPTAVFASNDEMAAAAIATAHRHHIQVPEGLTVCGYDDTFLATTVWPEITTIHQPLATMARASLQILEKEIRARRSGLDPLSEHKEFEVALIKRQSDAAPPLRPSARRETGRAS
jgi:LacI family transcriptional regulator